MMVFWKFQGSVKLSSDKGKFSALVYVAQKHRETEYHNDKPSITRDKKIPLHIIYLLNTWNNVFRKWFK